MKATYAIYNFLEATVREKKKYKAIPEINFNDLSKISSQHEFNLNITNDLVSIYFFPH